MPTTNRGALRWGALTESRRAVTAREAGTASVPLWTAAGLSLLLAAAGAAVHLLNSLADVSGHPYWLGNSLSAVSYPLLGALILTYRPGHRIGGLWLLGGTITAVGVFAGEYGPYAMLVRPDRLPAGVFFAWVGNWSWWLNLAPVAASLLVFPVGHLRSRRWRLAAGALGLGVALSVVADALMPGPMRLMPGTNPFGLAGAAGVLDAARWSAAALQVVSAVAAVLGLLGRLGQARGIERQQLTWFAYASGLSILLLLGGLLLDGLIRTRLLGPVGLALGTGLLLPAALTVAVLRYRLFAIDRVINRTLVYGALTLIVATVYITLVGYASDLVQDRGATAVSLLVTGVVAVVFQPLRAWLQQMVNRLLYGQRDEPYAVLSALGRRLETTLAPETVLSTIVQTVAGALNLPYVALVLTGASDEALAAAVGTPVEPLVRLPLVYQHEAVGELVLGARGHGEAFGPTDEALLRDLARQAGMAVHAVRLTADLQQARERLVSAREEERRRLRRDLHDGLGPQLASLTLSIEAARTLIPRDPAAADVLLRDLRGHAQAAIADIRRLVYALRPPALDDLGLVAAIREQATRAATAPLQVTVQAPESLPALSAAAEVAAYRIVQEALTNVVRHAGARTCVVRLACPSDGEAVLRLLIEDDGRGLPADVRAGVGLTSIRERAAELGGTCSITSGGTGGTRVEVVLPLGPRSAPDRVLPISEAAGRRQPDGASPAHQEAGGPGGVDGRSAEHG